MSHCFRLLLTAYVIYFSLAGGPDQPSLRQAAIAETQTETPTARPVESVKPFDWARWLWMLVPVAVAGSVIFAVSRGSRKPRTNRLLSDSALSDSALSDNKSDPSGMELNEICDQRSPESALSETTRLAKVDIVETLMADLQSQDADKRRQGIWELGQRGDSRAIQPLVDLLIDSDSMQRSLILAAVSEIAVRSLKPMNRALMLSLQDESPDVRKNAIRDVTRIYDAMAQMSQLLHYAASDTHAEVQDTAHWALHQMSRIRSLSESEASSSSPQSRFGEKLAENSMSGDQNSQL